jgi:hypothetical protein
LGLVGIMIVIAIITTSDQLTNIPAIRTMIAQTFTSSVVMNITSTWIEEIAITTQAATIGMTDREVAGLVEFC